MHLDFTRETKVLYFMASLAICLPLVRTHPSPILLSLGYLPFCLVSPPMSPILPDIRHLCRSPQKKLRESDNKKITIKLASTQFQNSTALYLRNSVEGRRFLYHIDTAFLGRHSARTIFKHNHCNVLCILLIVANRFLSAYVHFL